jgi:rSAM/selenodomain-associated transferase 1
MRSRRHLVIFAKAPALGRVKRRLAAGIGALAALRFQRDNTARLLRRVGTDRRWRCWLALTPDRSAAGPRFWRVPCRRIAQGSGDLGRRMARPFDRLPAGPVIVIGSDIPAIAGHHIAAAFRLLGDHDLVFGPARDGGYWLVGARRRPLPRGLFGTVRWSTAHALADTLANVPRRLRVGIAATLDDVDDERGYRRFIRRSASRPLDAPGAGA